MATVPNPQPDHQEQQRPPSMTALPSVERKPRYGQPFFPVVPAGSVIYILATVVALVVLAITTPAPLQNPADPLNHEHVNPRPEWYFLFLFQLLKYFQGPWEIVGTAVLPAVLGLILVALPFYDRNWSKRAARRPFAIGSAAVALFGLVLLTYIPLAGSAPQGSGDLLTAVAPHPKYTNIQAIFAKNCQPCHYNAPYSANLNLTTYAGALAGGNGAGLGAPKKVIVPGSASGSYLWQVVAWKQKVGATMPLGQSQISKVDQQNIANWIADGAKNQ